MDPSGGPLRGRGARDEILYIPGVHPGEKEDH
nr:MAG TPA: hypothetical protein [Caudoviricetes sp.]